MTFDHRAVTLAVFGLLALSSDSTIGGNSNVLVSAASWPWGGPLPTHSPVVPPPIDFCYTDNGAEVCIYFNDDLTCDVTLYGMSFRTGLAASFCASLAAEHQPDEFESLRASEHLSSQPSLVPSSRPTVHSSQPSSQPSKSPSLRPSSVPSSSSGPTAQPSEAPSSEAEAAEMARKAAQEAQKAAEMAAAVAKEAEEALKAALKEAEKAAKEAQKEAEKAQEEAKNAAAANEEDPGMMLEEEESVFLSLMYTGRRVATVGGTEESLLFQSLGLRQRRGRTRAHAVRRRETAIKNRRENMDK